MARLPDGGLGRGAVVVREMSDREAAELALIENLQREDLNPMDEAQGYQTLMEAYGLTQEEAARVVNKSRPAVANSLRLLHLPEPVKELVGKGRLAAGPRPGAAGLPGGAAGADGGGNAGEGPYGPRIGASRQAERRKGEKTGSCQGVRRAIPFTGRWNWRWPSRWAGGFG